MKEIHKPRMTANMAMVTDANGIPSASTNITKTELGMLNNIRTNIQNQIDSKVAITSSWGMPDYTAGVTVTSDGFIAPCDGIFIFQNTPITDDVSYVVLNGNQEIKYSREREFNNYGQCIHGTLLIPKGTVVTFNSLITFTGVFYPLMKE